MKKINIETALKLVQNILGYPLSDVQQAVFHGVWTRRSYQDITSADNGQYYSVGHLKNTASELWQLLGDALGERVSKTNLQAVLERYQVRVAMAEPYQDWGEAVLPTCFYGRTTELATLTQWLQDCRVISIVGMGGMGKTSLAIRLMQDAVQNVPQNVSLVSSNTFASVVSNSTSKSFGSEVPQNTSMPSGSLLWRTLLNAPPIEAILKEMIQFLSNRQELDYPGSVEGKIARVLHYLKQGRYLIVLDNLESVLQSGSAAGVYRPGYEGYGLLIQRIGEADHASCLVVTSREKPKEVALLEGLNSPVRSFALSGLATNEGQKIFQNKGCFGLSQAELQQVLNHFAGNPLALNILASSVQELFEGDMADLIPILQQGYIQFADIQDMLTQQFERLPEAEQTVLYWLAINREPVGYVELMNDLVSAPVKLQLLEALKSLGRRCLIERHDKQWSLQPVVMEYVTNRLVMRVCEEINRQTYHLLNSHALLKAQGKDYIQQAQTALILQPLLDCLLLHLGGSKNVELHLKEILQQQRTVAPLQPGYLGGNLLNLLRQLSTNLSGIDCSYLNIWQAYLQDVSLCDANFSHANISRSVFTETLNATLSVAFSPDGQLFAASNADGKVRVWQVSDERAVLTLAGHSSWVASISFSPDSKTLASASFDQSIKLWDLTSGTCLNTLRGYSSQLWAVVRFSPDGRYLVSAGDSCNALKLWDSETGRCLRTLTGHSDLVFTVEFSPDGRLLASGSNDNLIQIWDVQTGDLLNRLVGHESWVRAVTFGPNGTLLSGSNDQTIKRWNVYTGECLDTLHGHQHLILALALSNDGRTLASGSQDTTVRIWDIQTGRCLRVLQGHPNGIWSVAFHPDGQTLISGSNDSMVKLWNVRTGQALKTNQLPRCLQRGMDSQIFLRIH